ncbi:MAG: heavy metal-binding domain-containing protein [Gemmatimonadaceae bacterium]|nr:heavy metal-binding domain-containing protein [Gemmatimonadaceae bacterium]
MTPETVEWESVMLTTAPSLEGWNVTTTHDVIASECALGMGLIGDLFTAGTNALGGRSAATERVLREARIACLSDLRRTALALGANAVIAVRLAYSECSGSILLVVASGTAVSVSSSSVTPRRR